MPDTQHMLSTIDNPYSPVTDWDRWYNWDAAAGYHTPSFLARVAILSPALSSADEEAAIEDAIEEIVRENVLGIYIKVPVLSEAA
jgi:hypothetical protein